MWASLTFYLLVNSFGSLKGVSTRVAGGQRVLMGSTLYTVEADDLRERGHHLVYWRTRGQQEVIKVFVFMCVAL